MIWGTWRDPNFRFDAVDRKGKAYKHFCHANSEDDLRRRLGDAHLTVKNIEPYDFADWKCRAQAAAQKALKVHLENEAEPDPAKKKVIPFTQAIWAELKWHLFDLFHGKCAYCESKPLPSAHGQVEHYRPKSKVSGDPAHPGYYWLAYEVTNLLPACGRCNGADAKSSHFPILGTRARDADGLAGEEPLLLNPFNHEMDPYEHLEFDAVGDAKPRNGSLHGFNSTKYYDLNRPDLFEARNGALRKVETDWSTLAGVLSSYDDRYRVFLAEISMGKRPYSAAQRWHLERIAQRNA
jgi:hypothetical protein